VTVAEKIGRNLTRLREPTGLSQEEIGFRAEMHRTAVGQIERGVRIPRSDSLLRIAGALGCSPCELLEGLSWRPTTVVRGDFGEFEESS
jgi:transcriptional regulator with XRE-family HTH domain